MPSQRWTQINQGPDRDSLELASLASSHSDGNEAHSPASSRNLSPWDSPLGSDFGEDRDPRHERTESGNTVESFQLQQSTDIGPQRQQALDKQKSLTYFNCLALVMGLQVGSGIFSSPGTVDHNAGSIGSAIIVWAVAGVLAWTGACSYTELGSTIPLNGSSQAYLNYVFGPLAGFLFAWTALMVLKPGSAAIIALVFGEYVVKMCVGTDTPAPFWAVTLAALGGLAFVALLNCFSTKSSTRAGNGFLVLKLGLLLLIFIVGIVGVAKNDTRSAQISENWFNGASTNLGNYAVALIAGVWAYDGWDNVNYVTSEMKNFRRDLPRVIHTAMPVVIFCYLLVNLAYFMVLDKDEVRATQTVAVVLAGRVMGRAGEIIVSLMIALSCLGALNATTFTAGRLAYASAQEGHLPNIFSRLSAGNTPVYCIVLECTLAAVFIFFGGFESLVMFYGVSSYLFYFVTVASVLVLRFREPELDRPYKTYLTTPVIFCSVALFLISYGFFEKPRQALLSLLFIGSGIPVYFLRHYGYMGVSQSRG
ncbi:b(0,+)-type amino acid transporter 1 [Yarrowia sp. E02]|nr:b(0,+)-type amino acid transporter 1 [Yarrowia sp. E02]